MYLRDVWIYVFVPQIALAIGVLTVLDKGPWLRRRSVDGCGGAFSIVIYNTWWYLPSKTHDKIYILMELLRSVREWCHIIDLRPSRGHKITKYRHFWKFRPAGGRTQRTKGLKSQNINMFVKNIRIFSLISWQLIHQDEYRATTLGVGMLARKTRARLKRI